VSSRGKLGPARNIPQTVFCCKIDLRFLAGIWKLPFTARAPPGKLFAFF
jgi:hypothetical protein